MMIAARNAMLMSGSSTPTARDYVQSGLVAMWDGIENAGWGTHETAPTRWKNLIEDSPYPDFIVESGKTFGADHLIVDGLSAESASAWPDSFSQLETCYRCDDGWAFFNVNIQRKLQWGISHASSAFPQFSGSGAQGQNVFNYSEFAPGIHNSISIVYAATGYSGAVSVWVNGENRLPTGTSRQLTTTPNVTCIGSRKGVSSAYNTATGIVNSIRLYSRALTAAEVAANYAIDAARFGL